MHRAVSKINFFGGVILFLTLFIFLPTGAYALERWPFKGQADLSQKKFNIVLGGAPENSVSIQVELLSQNHFRLNLKLEDVKTSVFEISTDLESLVELSATQDKNRKSWQGHVWSRYSLINRKPVDELSGKFEIKNQTLYLPSLTVGQVDLKGFLELFFPYKTNFSLELKDIPMKDFLSLWVDDPDLNAKGSVSGTIQISGTLGRLLLKGNLASYHGSVGDLDFDSILLNVEGPYPILKLTRSTITQSDGISFAIEGNFDLSNKDNFEKEVESLRKSPLISEEDSSWEWTVKRNSKEKQEQPSSEFKYFLRKKDGHDDPLKEPSDLMGVEQNIKF